MERGAPEKKLKNYVKITSFCSTSFDCIIYRICHCLMTWQARSIWVADKITYYSQWTWPKWVVPYRLWRFSHKFEHPKSTLYYFSLPLILSDTHMGHPFRQRHSGISFEVHLQMCFCHKPSSTWHRDSVAGKPRQATTIGGEAVHWDVRPETRQFGHNP